MATRPHGIQSLAKVTWCMTSNPMEACSCPAPDTESSLPQCVVPIKAPRSTLHAQKRFRQVEMKYVKVLGQ